MEGCMGRVGVRVGEKVREGLTLWVEVRLGVRVRLGLVDRVRVGLPLLVAEEQGLDV